MELACIAGYCLNVNLKNDYVKQAVPFLTIFVHLQVGGNIGEHVDREGKWRILLPTTQSAGHKVCLHQLWRVVRAGKLWTVA